MRKDLLKFGAGLGLKTSLAGLEMLAVVACIVLLVGGACVWRLASGPFDVTFARKYIEDALYEPSTATAVAMEDVSLSWPVLNGPLELTLKNVTLERQGRRIASVQDVALGLSTTHLLLGRVEPIVIMLRKPVLGLIRTEDNHFRISLHQDQSLTVKADTEGDPLAEIIQSLTAPPTGNKKSPLAVLKTVRIADATLLLEDHYAGQTWYLQHMNFEFGRDKQGLAVSAGFALPGGSGKTQPTVHLDAIYGRERGDIKFNLNLDDVDLATGAGKVAHLDFLYGQTLVVSGDLSGTLNKAMELQSMNLSLASPSGAIAVHNMYNEPLPYQNLQLQAAYDGVAQAAAIKKFQLTVRGVTLNGSADMAMGHGSARTKVRLNIPQLAQAQIGPLWPDSLREDGAHAWLVEKLSVGTISHIDAGFDVTAQRQDALSTPDSMPASDAPPQWSIKVENVEGAFDMTDMSIDYRAPLMPAKGAAGHGVFKNGDLDIDIKKGLIGDLNVAGSHVKLVNVVHAHEGHADIDVKAKGPLKTLFRYIQDEPINLSRQQLGFKADEAKGGADLAINVMFPTTKHLLAEEVKVKVDGALNDIELPDIVEGMALTGGPFHLSVADAAAKLSGAGKLDGHDIKVSLQQYLHAEGKPFASRIDASMMADEALRARFGMNISDWVSGAVPVDVIYQVQPDHTATVDLKADMTPGSIMVAPVGYTKPPGVAGEVACTVNLTAGKVQRITALHVKTPDLAIDNGAFQFGPRDGRNTLTGGVLPDAKLGETSLSLDFRLGDNRQVTVDGKGAFLDATYFLTNKNKAAPDAPPLIATILVDKMRTGPGRTIENVNLLFDRAGNGGGYNRIKLTADAGKGAMNFTLLPDATGRLALNLTAEDAGGMLRAFDIYKNAEGGKLSVRGMAPDVGEKKIIRGHGQISDFKVVRAPVLARLLNAVNLIGIPELLGGNGIAFTRLEGDFEWDILPGGDRYVIKDGRTSGASMGLTFGGTVDKGTGMTKINGTIVPVSGINGLVGHIPVLGDLLTGGGALIAFTYSIDGPSANPGISVNPLSALAPGILREIFFTTK